MNEKEKIAGVPVNNTSQSEVHNTLLSCAEDASYSLSTPNTSESKTDPGELIFGSAKEVAALLTEAATTVIDSAVTSSTIQTTEMSGQIVEENNPTDVIYFHEDKIKPDASLAVNGELISESNSVVTDSDLIENISKDPVSSKEATSVPDDNLSMGNSSELSFCKLKSETTSTSADNAQTGSPTMPDEVEPAHTEPFERMQHATREGSCSSSDSISSSDDECVNQDVALGDDFDVDGPPT